MKFLSNVLIKAGLIVEGTTDLQGTSTAVTPTLSDNSTKLATTAFVKGQGYITGESDTLQTVTNRGDSTTNSITAANLYSNGLVVSSGAMYSNVGFFSNNNGNLRYTFDTNDLVLRAGTSTSNEYIRVFGADGNTSIGTTANNGFKLEVYGSARVQSFQLFNPTYPTYNFSIGSIGSAYHRIVGGYGNEYIDFGGPSGNMITITSNALTLANSSVFTAANAQMYSTGLSGLSFSAYNLYQQGDTRYGFNFTANLTGAIASGTSELTLVRFNPSISTSVGQINAYMLALQPVINPSAGTTVMRGFYYNPTLTSTTGLTNIAFESTSGIFKISDLSGTGTRMVVADSSGVLSTQAIPSGNTGTVTSVALSLPNIFSVSGSPVTTSGTLTATLANQTANTVFAGPTTGSAAAPTFRALVAADIPALSYEPVITAGTTAQYWRGDKTWQDFNTSARAAISLTTTGSSGASTYNSTTGVLNVPNYTFNGLSPMTTLGDIIYGGASGAATRLAGNTAASKRFLIQTGDGTNSAAPSWGSIVAGDLPSLFIGTTAIQSTSANQALTGITGITFVAQTSDTASITTTISSTSTFFDFNLSDDNNNDEWRWRFTPSGSSVYNAMRLVPVSNTASDLIVSGTITASNFSGSSSGTNTGDQTISLTGDVTGSGTGSFATAIGAGKVTNAMLSGSITASKLATFGAGDAINWAANTDGGFIKFVSSGDGLGESYMEIGTTDNNDEPIKFTQSGNVRVQIDTDGKLKNGAGVEYALSNAYLPLSGGTLTGSLTGTTASFSTSTNTTAGVSARNTNNGTAAGGSLFVGNNNTTNGGGITLFSSGFTATGQYRTSGTYFYSNQAGGLTIHAEGANSMYLATNGTTALTINSSQVATFSSSVTAGSVIYATNGGVDGTFADAFVGRYSGNTNEQNAIQTTVSSIAQSSGFRFQVSNGGGSSARTDVADLRRDRAIFYTNVGIGTSSPSTALHVLGSAEGIYVGRIAGAVDYGPHLRLQKARGTTSSPTIVANGDTLGSITFEPYNGTGYTEQTGIRGIVNGTVSSGSIPVDMIFCAGINGTTGTNERMRITSGGNVGIGITSISARLHVSGTVEANGSLYRAIFGGTVQDADMTGLSGGNGSELQLQAASSTRGAFLTIGGGMGSGEAMGGIAFYNSNNTDGKRLRSYFLGGQEGATANEQGGYLVFGTAANAATTPTERMRITSGGDIIKATGTGFDGTFDNVIKYMARGDINVNNNRWNGIDSTITAGSASANAIRFRVYQGSSAQDQPPLTVMSMLGNGRVGIGTADPNGALQIQVDSNFTGGVNYTTPHLFIRSGASAASGNVTRLAMGVFDGAQVYLDTICTSTGGGAADLAIATRNVGAPSERIRITSDGNVLIGETTSSTSRLVVRKDSAGGRGGEISIVNYAASSTNNSAALNFGLEASTYDADLGNAQIKAQITNGANSASDLIMSTWNGSSFGERFRIASAGAATFSSSVTATSFFESSDARLKKVIDKKIDYNAISKIEPKYYIKNGTEELGYFAQDLEGLLDSALERRDNGLLDLAYRQVHTAKIAALENEIRELKLKLNG